MLDLPRSALVLWCAIVTLGLALLAASGLAASADWRLAPAVCLFAVAGAIGETFRVNAPASRSRDAAATTVSTAVYVAMVLVFPPEWAIPGVAISWLLVQSTFRRVVWFKALFNITQAAVSAAAASGVWALAGSGRSLADPWALPIIAAAAATFVICNTWLVAAIMALVLGLPIRRTWWRSHRHLLATYASLIAAGVVLAALWSLAPWLLPCVLVLLAGMYYAMRNAVALETTTVESLFRLADVLDARDTYTHGHSLRVGEYAERLALALGLSDERAHLVLLAGRLHDIGKCAVRNEVLLKPGPLDDDERAHMCTHSVVGGMMLEAYPFFNSIAADVRSHHERWDGRGYPDGLRGDAITLGARLIAVADAYDAMTTSRPYRRGLDLDEARRRLAEGAGTQWDPEVVTAFLGMLEQDRAAGRKEATIVPPSARHRTVTPALLALRPDRTPRAPDGTPLSHTA